MNDSIFIRMPRCQVWCVRISVTQHENVQMVQFVILHLVAAYAHLDSQERTVRLQLMR